MKTSVFPWFSVLLVAFPVSAQNPGEEIGQWMGRVLAIVVLALVGWRLYSRHRDEIAERKRKEWRRRMLEQQAGADDAPVAGAQRGETDA